MSGVPKWRQFERLVAAIHAQGDSGATVTWNDTIGGRQFDATVRFKRIGYDYLTVVEARNYSTDVPVGDVEAFVTKAHDAHANKAIIIAAKGFQSGAREAALRHGIELYTLAELDSIPDWMLVTAVGPALHIVDVVIETDAGSEIPLPHLRSELLYHLVQTRFLDGPRKGHSLQQFIEGERAAFEPTVSRSPVSVRLALPEAPVLLGRPFQERACATAIRFTAEIAACTFVDTHGLDPDIVSPRYRLTNVATGDTREITDPPLGFDSKLAPGGFYKNPNLGTAYYCEGLEGTLAHLVLVESYQHGNLVQMRYSQDVKYQGQYVPVTDEPEIARLGRLYTQIAPRGKTSAQPAAPRKSRFQVGRNDPCPCGSSKKFKKCCGRRNASPKGDHQ